jgi:linoleate 10R-lipoxygenase
MFPLAAYNLSAWGYQDCTYTKGGITALTKLLLRTLPLSYTFNSVYAHFSLLVPSAIRASLEKDGTANLYDFQKPVTQSAVAVVATYKSLQSVLSDKHKFHLVFGDRLRYLSNGNR